jgi:hypothetical protein
MMEIGPPEASLMHNSGFTNLLNEQIDFELTSKPGCASALTGDSMGNVLFLIK